MVPISRTIETALLRVFVTVAKHRGVTAAAETMGFAKSAVSKQLSALESLLGVRLFERTSRRVVLTSEGKLLLPRAESILAELDQFLSDAQHQVTEARGTVRISASPEFGAFLTAHVLPALLTQHVGLKVAMSLEYRFDDLHDPGVDLAFRLGSLHDDRLVGRLLGEFPRILVCSPDYARSCALNSPADLERANALIFSDQEFVEQWSLRSISAAARRQQVNVRSKICVRGFEALSAAAIAGLGVAQLPSFVAAPGLADGRLERVLPRWASPPVPVYLAFRPGIARVGRVRAVIDFASRTLPTLLKNLKATHAWS